MKKKVKKKKLYQKDKETLNDCDMKNLKDIFSCISLCMYCLVFFFLHFPPTKCSALKKIHF